MPRRAALGAIFGAVCAHAYSSGSLCGGTEVDVSHAIVEWEAAATGSNLVSLPGLSGHGSSSNATGSSNLASADLVYSSPLHDESASSFSVAKALRDSTTSDAGATRKKSPRFVVDRILFGDRECATYDPKRRAVCRETPPIQNLKLVDFGSKIKEKEKEGDQIAVPIKIFGHYTARTESPMSAVAADEKEKFPGSQEEDKEKATKSRSSTASSRGTATGTILHRSVSKSITLNAGAFVYRRQETPIVHDYAPKRVVGDDLLQLHGESLQRSGVFVTENAVGATASSWQGVCVEVHQTDASGFLQRRTAGNLECHLPAATAMHAILRVRDPVLGYACSVPTQKRNRTVTSDGAEMPLLYDLRLGALRKQEEIVLGSGILERQTLKPANLFSTTAKKSCKKSFSKRSNIKRHHVAKHMLQRARKADLVVGGGHGLRKKSDSSKDFSRASLGVRSKFVEDLGDQCIGSFGGGTYLRVIGQGFAPDDVIEVCGQICKTAESLVSSSNQAFSSAGEIPAKKLSVSPFRTTNGGSGSAERSGSASSSTARASPSDGASVSGSELLVGSSSPPVAAFSTGSDSGSVSGPTGSGAFSASSFSGSGAMMRSDIGSGSVNAGSQHDDGAFARPPRLFPENVIDLEAIRSESREMHAGVNSFQSRFCETPKFVPSEIAASPAHSMSTGSSTPSRFSGSFSAGSGFFLGSKIGISGSEEKHYLLVGSTKPPGSDQLLLGSKSRRPHGSFSAGFFSGSGSGSSFSGSFSDSAPADSEELGPASPPVPEQPFPHSQKCDVRIISRATGAETVLKDAFEYQASLTPVVSSVRRRSADVLLLQGDDSLSGFRTRVFWNDFECQNVGLLRPERHLEDPDDDVHGGDDAAEDGDDQQLPIAAEWPFRKNVMDPSTGPSFLQVFVHRRNRKYALKKHKNVPDRQKTMRGAAERSIARSRASVTKKRLQALKKKAAVFETLPQTMTKSSQRLLLALQDFISDEVARENRPSQVLDTAEHKKRNDPRSIHHARNTIGKFRNENGVQRRRRGQPTKVHHKATLSGRFPLKHGNNPPRTREYERRGDYDGFVVRRVNSDVNVARPPTTTKRTIVAHCPGLFASAGRVSVYEPGLGFAFEGDPSSTVNMLDFGPYFAPEAARKRPAFLPDTITANRDTFQPLKSAAGETCEVRDDCPPGWQCCPSFGERGRNHCVPTCLEPEESFGVED
ncbi:unnamed protein product [Amoebophrya sp. A25]|nr:unnamed protein product [Amoebophrya sp. A25]|eukprot:GSA25T00013551001.1